MNKTIFRILVIVFVLIFLGSNVSAYTAASNPAAGWRHFEPIYSYPQYQYFDYSWGNSTYVPPSYLYPQFTYPLPSYAYNNQFYNPSSYQYYQPWQPVRNFFRCVFCR